MNTLGRKAVNSTPLMTLAKRYYQKAKDTGIPVTKTFPVPYESMRNDYFLNWLGVKAMYVGGISIGFVALCPSALWNFITGIPTIVQDMDARDQARWSKKPEAFCV